MYNLDYICIKYAQKISTSADENILRKTLGVLQEDGVYAMFLWIQNKEKNLNKELIEMLNDEYLRTYFFEPSETLQGNSSTSSENSLISSEDFKEFCEKLKEIAKDLDKLLFIKKILERILTYALYHAKVGS